MRRSTGCTWILFVMILFWSITEGFAAILTVTASRANIRTGPGASHRVLTSVVRGTTLPLLDTKRKWYQIRLDDGRKGWIASSIVQLSQKQRGLRVTSTPKPAASRGLALVIGNADYAKAPLRNPVNDASVMATTLTDLGFEVTRLLDVPQREMETAIRQFGRRLRRGGVGLFYFAGHGMQVGGENFLIPIDAQLHEETDLRYEAVHVGRVLDALDNAENGLNIVILDACRNNPFARSWRRTRGAPTRGLAVVQAARGTLIAYATAPGAVAADGVGQHGLYTQHLLQHLQVPGQRVEQMFKQVRVSVMKATGGQQMPWESSSLTGDFSFKKAASSSLRPQAIRQPQSTPARPAATPGSPDPEAETWAVLKSSSYVEDVEAFLSAYPSGRYAVAARLKLQQLKRQRQRDMQRQQENRQRESEQQRLAQEQERQRKAEQQRLAQEQKRQRKAEQQRLAQERAQLEKERQQLAEQREREAAKARAQAERQRRQAAAAAAKSSDPPASQKQTVVARLEPDVAQSDTPSVRFIAHDNGTILDTQTNLMWMAEDYFNVKKRFPFSWTQAEAWAYKMNRKRYGGHRDWRLPTVEEYRTIYSPDKPRQSGQGQAVGYPAAFPDGGGRWFWTSETFGEGMMSTTDVRSYAFVLDFATGSVSEEHQDSSQFSVRLVRSVRK